MNDCILPHYSGISFSNWPCPKTDQHSHHEHVPIHHWCPDSWGCARLVELHARDAVRLWAFKNHLWRCCVNNNKICFWHTHNQGVSFWVHWLHALWPCRRLCWWLIQSCCAGPLRCDLWWTVLTFLFSSEIRKMTTKLDLVSLQRCVFPLSI